MVSGFQFLSPYLWLSVCALSASLLGCAHPRDRIFATHARVATDADVVAAPERPVPKAVHGPYNFHWHLSGQRQAGPSQVFSTPEGVWLSFDRDLRLPIVFGSNEVGQDVLLHPERIPPYVFVQGDWSRLVFRLGHLAATAVKQTQALRPDHHSSVYPATDPLVDLSVHTHSEPFRASTDDRNMRRVLKRWAKTAGWTFGFDHWTLDVDIPVSASVDLGSDFTTAVRALLASTEMSDRPAQPCFYTNKVLRVIGASQQCDPRRHPASAGHKQAVL